MEKSQTHWVKALKVFTVLAISATLSLGAYMLTAKEVVLTVDGRDEEIRTYANTIEELLEERKIFIDEYTYINYPLDTKVENNMNIMIETSKPYTISMRGVQNEIVSIYTTVGDILKDQNIDLDQDDYTYPDIDKEVAPGAEITIYKVDKVIEEVEEVIPFQKLVRKTDELDIGNERLAQEGENGLKKIKIGKTYENGKLVKEEVVEEVVVKEAVPEIVERGTRNVKTSSRGSFRYSKVMTMTATAYDLSYESTGKRPGDRWYGITASGTKVRPGVVAVDPNVIPLGTKLYVESLDGTPDYGFCVAEDTGGAIKGNKIDLFFETAEEVRRFGRRKVRVYILDNNR